MSIDSAAGSAPQDDEGDESEYAGWSHEDLCAADVTRSKGADAAFWYDGNYDKLVRNGAALVEDKVVAVESLTLPNWEDAVDEDSETTCEMVGGNVPPEKIQADVRALREERGVNHEEQQREDRPTANPEKINWPALWDDLDIPPKRPQSLTQLGLMAEASPRTSVGEHGQQVAEEAVKRGRIVRRGNKYIPEEWA